MDNNIMKEYIKNILSLKLNYILNDEMYIEARNNILLKRLFFLMI